MFQRMHNYPVGSRVQHRTGYVFIKTQDGMKAEHRAIVESAGYELKEGDRVFHKNGQRDDNRFPNLAVIHFNITKYVLLKSSRVLYIPPARRQAALIAPRTNQAAWRLAPGSKISSMAVVRKIETQDPSAHIKLDNDLNKS